LRIVDSALRLGLPCDISRGIIRIDADDVELVEILEIGLRHAVELAAEDEMEKLFCRLGVRHGVRSARSIPRCYDDARRPSPRSLMSAACRSRPVATSIPCRGTGRL